MDRIHWQSSGKDRCSKSQAAIGTVGPMQPALPGSFWVSADEKRCLVFAPRHFVLQALGEGRKEHTSQNHTAAALLTGMSVRTVAAVLSVIRRRGGAARCPIVASVVVEPARGLQACRSCFGIASATSRCGCLLTAKRVRVFVGGGKVGRLELALVVHPFCQAPGWRWWAPCQAEGECAGYLSGRGWCWRACSKFVECGHVAMGVHDIVAGSHSGVLADLMHSV